MTNLLVLDNTQLTYRYSVKLVYILFVDTLLQRYDTEIVTMLC